MAYSSYKGQCLGRLIHFMYETNRNLGELSHFGDGSVTRDPYGKELIATYEWNNDGDGDIPLFTFIGKYQAYQDVYERAKNEIIKYEEQHRGEIYSKKAEQETEAEEKRLRWEKLKAEIMSSS